MLAIQVSFIKPLPICQNAFIINESILASANPQHIEKITCLVWLIAEIVQHRETNFLKN